MAVQVIHDMSVRLDNFPYGLRMRRVLQPDRCRSALVVISIVMSVSLGRKSLRRLLTQSTGIELIRIQEVPDKRLRVVDLGKDVREDEDPWFGLEGRKPAEVRRR